MGNKSTARKGTGIRMKIYSLLHNESTGGVLLLVCAVIAVTLASVPGGEWFGRMWETHGGFDIGGFGMEMSLRHWVNDALMAVFFFTVGLEIKREMISGQLSSLRKSALPVVAAIGGMLVPALIYMAFNAGKPETANGWGIPMATDIAFAIGILSLLGDRVPAGLKVFLTALAIVDDLGAIIVLAIFYPSHALHLDCLLYVAGIMAVLAVFNRAGIRNKYFYIIPGIVMWYFTYMSGIHATISGVLLAMMIPSKGGEHSLMQTMEHRLHPVVSFLIMPVFALANAGVALDLSGLSDSGMAPVALGIFFGLLVGKPAGIFLFSLLGIKLGLATRPDGTKWGQLAATGILGGIGFTMSIFVNNLAFSDPAVIDTGKISILLTSASAAVAGLIAMSLTCRKGD